MIVVKSRFDQIQNAQEYPTPEKCRSIQFVNRGSATAQINNKTLLTNETYTISSPDIVDCYLVDSFNVSFAPAGTTNVEVTVLIETTFRKC